MSEWPRKLELLFVLAVFCCISMLQRLLGSRTGSEAKSWDHLLQLGLKKKPIFWPDLTQGWLYLLFHWDFFGAWLFLLLFLIHCLREGKSLGRSRFWRKTSAIPFDFAQERVCGLEVRCALSLCALWGSLTLGSYLSSFPSLSHIATPDVGSREEA